MGKKLKYMGSADVRQLLKGDDFGGQLATPLKKDVRFTRANSWVVDSDEVELSDAALEVLLAERLESGAPAFRDVSGKELIPTNLHQQIFLGMRKTTEVELSDEEQKADAETAAAADADAKAKAKAKDTIASKRR